MSVDSSISKLSAIRRDTVRKIRQVGLLRTVQHGLQKITHDISTDHTTQNSASDSEIFDKKYGTDTERIISVGALDIPDEKLAHSNRYEAVVPEVFDEIMQDLAIDYSRFIFFDIGSGKGRALLIASLFPFKEIVGVEISAALTEIAQKNIKIFKNEKQQCKNIKTLCVDGGSFELPTVDAVLYFNNPFDDKVMRPLVSRIEASLAEHNRKFLIIYQRPLHREIWDNSPAFDLICERHWYLIYESRPVGQRS